jgi:hypothetical protein
MGEFESYFLHNPKFQLPKLKMFGTFEFGVLRLFGI